MSEKISRRDFLKLASVGAATTAVLTGCGPASRYVQREPYMKMPEYTYNGLSTYYATTCRECAAGCGLIVRTMQGRAIKVEGNPNHPVNLRKDLFAWSDNTYRVCTTQIVFRVRFSTHAASALQRLISRM